jgi:hypothetical protein
MEDINIIRPYARYICCGECVICIPVEKYSRMVDIDKWMDTEEYESVVKELMLFPQLKKALFLEALLFENQEMTSEIDLVMDVIECMSSKSSVEYYDTFVQCAYCGDVTFMLYQHDCNKTELSLYKTNYFNVMYNWCQMHEQRIFHGVKYTEPNFSF